MRIPHVIELTMDCLLQYSGALDRNACKVRQPLKQSLVRRCPLPQLFGIGFLRFRLKMMSLPPLEEGILGSGHHDRHTVSDLGRGGAPSPRLVNNSVIVMMRFAIAYPAAGYWRKPVDRGR